MSFCFLIASGDFVTPSLVGGPETYMAGVFIDLQFIEALNWPLASALSFSVLVVAAVIIFLIRSLVMMVHPRW